jgi:hypothetical protein
MNQALKQKMSAVVLAAVTMAMSGTAFAAGECKPVAAQSQAVYRCESVTVTAKRLVPQVAVAANACVPVAGKSGVFRCPAIVVTAKRSAAADSAVAANEHQHPVDGNLIAVSAQAAR